MRKTTSQNKQTGLEIPHGRILNITLFLVQITEFGRSLFADDLAIYIPTKNQKVEIRARQGVAKKLNAWPVERELNFFPSKTVHMVFRIRIKRNEDPLEITIRNQIIPCKEHTQFQEMTLDNRMNWKEHIDRVRAKAKRTLSNIKRGGKMWG